MAPSNIARRRWWIGDTECSDAGTVSLLASAASTFQLQKSILPDSISALEDQSVESAETLWAIDTSPLQKSSTFRRLGEACCDQPPKAYLVQSLHDVDKARLFAASSPHSGDWLHAPPITAVGLRLSDEAIRIAVAHRLGCKACEPHACVCPVDARGLHGLSCRKSAL